LIDKGVTQKIKDAKITMMLQVDALINTKMKENPSTAVPTANQVSSSTIKSSFQKLTSIDNFNYFLKIRK